jgi:glutamyl-Q tRNA(Asp) synthetase
LPATVTRFAPSPTGLIHLGSAYSALFAERAARRASGRFLLRIEDVDRTRCRPEFTAAIFEDLAWLGLRWEEPVRQQSEHFDDYRAALARLAAMELVYPCFCTRTEIMAEIAAAGGAPHAADPHGAEGPPYPGTCRRLDPAERKARLARGDNHALRLDAAKASAQAGPLTWHDRARGPQQARPERLGDAVLARKDVPTSYHLAVTLDDHLQGTTLVTRGEDLFVATHTHRLLQALLGLDTPEYLHHRLLLGPDGRRFAKRDRAMTIRAMREAGRTPAEVRALAGFPD